MRTVSFSSAPVRRKLKAQFVSHRLNSEGDPAAGKSMAHDVNDKPGRCATGIGRQNVQTLFLTPEGKIFHVVSGFRSDDDLVKELSFAKTLFDKMQNTKENKSQLVADLQKKRMLSKGYSAKQLDQAVANNDPGRNADRIRQMLQEQMANHRKAMEQMRRTGRLPRLPNFGAMNDPFRTAFQGKTKDTELGDYRFVSTSPLMDVTELLRSPEKLVGNGRSMFVSGQATGGQIGN